MIGLNCIAHQKKKMFIWQKQNVSSKVINFAEDLDNKFTEYFFLLM